ncbi:MAG: hypothetical protein Q9187_002937, partial [Circinaria calcarea]
MASPLTPLSASNQKLNIPTSTARKTFHSKTSIMDHDTENAYGSPGLDPLSSPFEANIEPDEYFPVKSKSPSKSLSPPKLLKEVGQGLPLTEDALRENDGLSKPLDVTGHTGENSVLSSENGNEAMSAIGGPKAYAGMDDTSFSTFSEVPNTDMTVIARIGKSPMMTSATTPGKSRRRRDSARTPAHSRPVTPGTSRHHDYDFGLASSSPTPRGPRPADSGNTTDLILDFTEQFSKFAQPPNSSPTRNDRPPAKKFHTQPDLASYTSGLRGRSPDKSAKPPYTPSEPRHLKNLLDFDITPAPTPRSLPSITVRELESVKASFLSQISSLQATLDGRQAEILSLKSAVQDAERRVGEASEETRDCRDAKEGLEADKAEWQKREKEMQSVLRSVKEETLRGEKEREELIVKAEEAEKRKEEAEMQREEAEMRAVDLSSKLSGMEAGTAASDASGDASTPGTSSNKAVEAAVQRVANELHSLYKTKHETKVVALKKSYEARWEKLVRELQAKVEEVRKENEELRARRDAIVPGVVPGTVTSVELEEERQRVTELRRSEEEMRGKVANLQGDLGRSRKDHEQVQHLLEKERLERGDLVLLVEEMLSIQAAAPAPPPPSEPPFQPSTSTSTATSSSDNSNFR